MKKLLKAMNKKNILGLSFLFIALLIFVSNFLGSRPSTASASISTELGTGGYNSTTTPLFSGAAVTTLRAGRGLLGSVIVIGSNGGNFQLYDATTSDVVSGNATRLATSSLLLASFPNNTSTSTYTFDVTLKYGLLLVTSGNIATSTITWK